MSDWISCPHCNLKHSHRPDGRCPRCGQWYLDPAPVLTNLRLAQAPAAARPSSASIDASGDPAWKELLGGLCLLGVAWYLHVVFGELATGARESVRLWWVIVMLYKVVGPTITVGLFGVVGAIATWMGLRRIVTWK